MALAFATDEADQPEDDALGWSAMRLSGLLATIAGRHPDRVAFRDQIERETWSGRPRIDWTYAFAHEIVGRLARFFADLGLPARAAVGICLPNGSEACLTLLAVEQAGLTPCLLPVAWDEEALARAVEAANVQAVVTQGVVGDQRPAELCCRLAARYFGLRFICSFGPWVPDGVVDLDRVILDPDTSDRAPASAAPPSGETGFVTFAGRDALRATPLYRPCPSVVGAAVAYLVAARIEAGERILSLLAPDDHRGLTTGLVAALLSGATLECEGLFSAPALVRSLQSAAPTHLVVPGWMEAHLAAVALPPSVVSVVLVHEAPVRFKARSVLRGPVVVDVLSFGELALVAGARDARGQFALSLDDETRRGPVSTRNLLRVRREADGALSFGGLACDVRALDRVGAPTSHRGDPWRASGFKADVFAGIVIGVS